jgi:hypothetical protein
MKLISFDIGIKNMAYCIFDISGPDLGPNFTEQTIRIQDWGILNLMAQETTEKPRCGCFLKTKTKSSQKNKPVENVQLKTCDKLAKYEKNGNYYCETHAKVADPSWIIPIKDVLASTIRKLSMDELTTLGKKYGIFNGLETHKSKKACLDKILEQIEKRRFEPIVRKKSKTASDTDLITVGRNMRTQLDLLRDVHDITHVIMENQISPLAARMKTVQGMLTQYYIMKDIPTIEFISSANKLKHLVPKDAPVGLSTDVPILPLGLPKEKPVMDKEKYKKHKTDSIHFCKQFLENNPELASWKSIMSDDNKNKRDDLADCFLQGIWYLMDRKLITYAYNLKINIV